MTKFLTLFLGMLVAGTSLLDAKNTIQGTPSGLSVSVGPTGGRPIKVGIYLSDPFVTKAIDGYGGFCIDLWKEIAADLGEKSEYVPFVRLPDLLEATSRGEVDIAVSNIFITGSRLKTVDFSQPYLQGGLQVMVNEKRTSSWKKLWAGLRDSGHLKIFAIGLVVILISTLLLTLGERHWNEEFHKDWANGLAESFYHVMSVSMTGKSSHKGLPGPFGKILAGIWIAFGVGVVAYITSSVTSVMTVNRLQGTINGAQDLPGHRVGTITGTVSNQYCDGQHLNTVTFTALGDAVKALVNKEIDAIVYDAMELQWYDNAHPDLPITEVGSIFEKRAYGFALPIGSPLRHNFNQSLLRQNESGFLESLRRNYFGDIQ